MRVTEKRVFQKHGLCCDSKIRIATCLPFGPSDCGPLARDSSSTFKRYRGNYW